ncbi:hypothetical protein EJ063_04505 [Vibrio aquaticus]|uniref:Cytochrome oxidase biogenesis cluster protein n=1 Tax=Vibrio aquaticus TaxID=2496559 RepID=A0A3S0Q3X3_9VIBR|nr:hypothetical protein [Vibrio aquaticus]RTZ18055.1 hypothetical protein EJ063_04505 [Vibrio aquaticus]
MTNNPVYRGRIIFVSLVVMFALPAIVAKTILSQHWYQSGVTNKGELIEPRTSYENLGLVNPFQQKQWQLGYVIPEQCDAFCQQQVYLLGQSHLALGKYQQRVEPVLLVTEKSDVTALGQNDYQRVAINTAFSDVVEQFEFVIVDPLGQLVMRYPKVETQTELVTQSKGLLADLRKLLKLSRVG